MNKVILIGRLAQDPDFRYTQSGKPVASFSLAVNRVAENTKKNTADFIPIVAWEKLAENCSNYLLKGSQVMVEGRMQVRNYEAQDGTKRYVTEVVAKNMEFLGTKKAHSNDQNSSIPKTGVSSFGKEVFPDEEIPF